MKLRTVLVVGLVMMGIAVVGEILALTGAVPWVPFFLLQTLAFIPLIYYAVVARNAEGVSRRR